ncbi:zinc-dependent metalloprotease [Halalkalicoccus sp. NIPERK01]|uniref:zinc-dependent metalloprotease n=1 Tax=Halalkalicoccus sp. NIPERK01 TaxID=3053469 RepID=UPI00256F3577|nr:zinc-dependent metalloprotease [Halalkalicoccus sp. NIPERK01]
MNFLRSLRTISRASGDGPVDWAAVGAAAKDVTSPGSVDLTEGEIEGYRGDVKAARRSIREVAAVSFDLPKTIEIQNRHHWIDANVSTFRRVMAPIEAHTDVFFPDASRVLNTGSTTLMLSFLGKNVLGQYDPLLLAEGDAGHALYFVHPNIRRVATELDVDEERFRRWIAFHEVAHAAEFGAAPWLSSYLESGMERGIEALANGSLDREAFRELDAAMTAVEGYAELIMDRAFDDEYADLREKVEERRRGGGPLAQLVRRMLGLGLKRRQYERGKAFFEAVADARGIEGASVVWDSPETLPTSEELDAPEKWLARVG